MENGHEGCQCDAGVCNTDNQSLRLRGFTYTVLIAVLGNTNQALSIRKHQWSPGGEKREVCSPETLTI